MYLQELYRFSILLASSWMVSGNPRAGAPEDKPKQQFYSCIKIQALDRLSVIFFKWPPQEPGTHRTGNSKLPFSLANWNTFEQLTLSETQKKRRTT
ncbi:unnamed protein product [Hermetia illucens]|uniref:Uncharacterized protein n=1 Tax=Hermetia illucens TaxID=343691 RepID=A0A7R8Z0D7_HERIL|nr:unnamed protein product [Hermetia illucens]